MNVQDLIHFVKNFNHIDQLIDPCSKQYLQGVVFERLFDIVIRFGFCDIFPKPDFKPITNNDNYLLSLINMTPYNNCSIILQNKNDDRYIFIVNKYPKTDDEITRQHSDDYYNIEDLLTMISNNRNIYKNYEIYLIVPNKREVLDRTDQFNEDHILDKTDLNRYFMNFKEDINENINVDWNTHYLN